MWETIKIWVDFTGYTSQFSGCRLNGCSCGRFRLAFFLSRKKVVLQKSQGDLHAKCNLFTGWQNGFIFLFIVLNIEIRYVLNLEFLCKFQEAYL